MRVLQPTTEELRARQARLLERSGFTSVEALEDRARRGALSAEEFALWDEIRSIDFLLGDESVRQPRQ